METIYDNTLSDEYTHEHVRAAREAGRDWAERELDLSEGRCVSSVWHPTDADARPLVSFPSGSEIEDQLERELELASICNDAARKRWAELTE
jgi:hypothetical protein